MRARWLFTALSVVLAACAPHDRSDPGTPTEFLLLGSGSGVVSVDPSTGRIVSDLPGVTPLGSWETVFTTEPGDGVTQLQTRDAQTGRVEATIEIPGRLEARVASGDGTQVAMMEPLPDGATPWVPESRTATSIVVADPTGGSDARTYDLRGNFEPEAFSVDGKLLFLISYLPASNPTSYRVTSLDLRHGTVDPVYIGGTKGVLAERMSGTRLEQVSSGHKLYTLYTTTPPEFAGAMHMHEHPASFVHVLDFGEGWAHCVLLPRALWDGDAADQAMAVSPDATRLYIVDTARDVVAVMDPDRLRIMDTARVDFGDSPGDAQATIAPDGTLVVADGPNVVLLDTRTLHATGGWTAPGPVSALGASEERLLVAVPGSVDEVDGATGERLRVIPSPELSDLWYVGIQAP